MLADRLSMFLHMYTLYWSLRPFGCSTLLASYTDDGPQLYMIDPSGSSWVCYDSWRNRAAGSPRPGLEYFTSTFFLPTILLGLLGLCHWKRQASCKDGTGKVVTWKDYLC